MTVDVVQEVLAALEREQVRYVVFGAVALALHGLPRATEDLGLFIAPDRENIERLKAALRSVFNDPNTRPDRLRFASCTRRPRARSATIPSLDPSSPFP